MHNLSHTFCFLLYALIFKDLILNFVNRTQVVSLASLEKRVKVFDGLRCD